MPVTITTMRIPCDPDQPVKPWHVPNTVEGVTSAIGARYFERVRTVLTADFGVVLVVDEEGLLRGREVNRRATWLYPGHVVGRQIVGDVLLAAEAETDDGIDFVSLTYEQTAATLDYLRMRAHYA